jgi:signal transduction histidine kinase
MKLPGPLNADQEKQLRTVQLSAKHLLLLINELLDLAKIEAGKFDLCFEATDCKRAVEEVAASLQLQAEAKGLQFNLEIPPHELIFVTDRRALSQITMNLLNNAIKFTQHGRVQVTASEIEQGGSRCLLIKVEDTGVGIRAEDQHKLFAAFSRVTAPGQSHEEGTGLGLHLSQQLAGMMGGKITLQSQYGVGSTFTAVLSEPES